MAKAGPTAAPITSGQGQANQFMQYNSDGLFIGEFGSPGLVNGSEAATWSTVTASPATLCAHSSSRSTARPICISTTNPIAASALALVNRIRSRNNHKARPSAILPTLGPAGPAFWTAGVGGRYAWDDGGNWQGGHCPGRRGRHGHPWPGGGQWHGDDHPRYARTLSSLKLQPRHGRQLCP